MYKYSVVAGLIIITLWCGCSEEPLQSDNQLEPELCNAACEAPDGYNCWYVSTRGSDSNSGTCEEPFKTVQYAIDTMSGGDYVYLREGSYYESEIEITYDKDGTCTPVSCDGANCTTLDCSGGSWSTLKSYPGEWGIIDGHHNGNYILGSSYFAYNTGYGQHFWKFENLEITGGGNSVNQSAGLRLNDGPFIIRGNYIHDNYETDNDDGENPGGIRGYNWHDSLVEFNYFKNNGVLSGGIENAAHIVLFTDYRWDEIANNGFSYSSERWPVTRNEFRYNYFSDGLIGFKHKGAQFFSSRVTWDDTYYKWGDKIHHNIFVGSRRDAIYANQDFVQIYNNIIDISQGNGISLPPQSRPQLYKAVTYNNQIKDTDSTGRFIIRSRASDLGPWGFIPNPEHYGWDYNNIFDGSNSNENYCGSLTLTITSSDPYSCDNSLGLYDVSEYYNDDNYFYRPTHTEVIMMQDVSYTPAKFELQTESGNTPQVYTNQYNAANPLFTGTTGADMYITLGSHVIEGSTTIANGGVGGSHPYLSGVTLPSYIGAVNPNDNNWVAGVLGLADTNVLKNMSTDIPGWVEGE